MYIHTLLFKNKTQATNYIDDKVNEGYRFEIREEQFGYEVDVYKETTHDDTINDNYTADSDTLLPRGGGNAEQGLATEGLLF